MQDITFIIIDGQHIKVLRRTGKYYVSLKLAKGKAKDGIYHLLAESEYLSENRDVLAKLLAGEVVKL